MDDKTPEFNTDYMDDPVCPWCGAVFPDAWEWDFNDVEQVREACDVCGREFLVTRDISVSYSTKKSELPKEDEMEPTVNKCGHCKGTGTVSVVGYGPGATHSYPCPTCSGAGRVVGVPDGQIVVACGDTVRTFPVMTTIKALEQLPVNTRGGYVYNSAVVNLVIQSALKGEEGIDE